MPATDRFSGVSGGVEAPVSFAAAVTPDDSNDLTNVTRGVYVGASGNVKVDLLGGSTVTFSGLAAGVVHPLRVTRIYATGTTATGILALW